MSLTCLVLGLARCGMGLFTGYTDVPSVSGVSTSPNPDGTVTVTISGSGFVNGSTVTINSVACYNVNVLSPTQLTCILPNGQIAIVNIIITTPSGGSTGGSGGSGGSGGVSAFHTLFVTSVAYDGNLGGLTGADSLCVARAAAGSRTNTITGTWRAILSSSTVNAKDRITFVTGASIKNTNGETIVASASDLWGGTLLKAVKYTESGNAVSSQVWTSTSSNGVKYTSDGTCNNWIDSSNSYLGSFGVADRTNSTWILASSMDGCGPVGSYGGALYCINSNN